MQKVSLYDQRAGYLMTAPRCIRQAVGHKEPDRRPLDTTLLSVFLQIGNVLMLELGQDAPGVSIEILSEALFAVDVISRLLSPSA